MMVRRGRRFLGWSRSIGTVVVLATLAACAGSPVAGTATLTPTTPSSPSTSAPSTTRSTPPTPSSSAAAPSAATSSDTSTGREPPGSTTAASGPASGTAAEALAPFFAEVDDIDARLSAAADAINAGLTAEEATFDQQTIDTVDAAAPWAAARAIPAGLDAATEQAVLLVYSNLASRFGALRGGDCLQVGTVPRSTLNADCFVRGHEPKARMAGDIAAARAAAESSPFAAASPDSRAAAEVLLRVEYINKANMGCGTMGGFIATEPLPIEWVTESFGEPELAPTDGRVNGVRFRAVSTASAGWTIELLAC